MGQAQISQASRPAGRPSAGPVVKARIVRKRWCTRTLSGCHLPSGQKPGDPSRRSCRRPAHLPDVRSGSLNRLGVMPGGHRGEHLPYVLIDTTNTRRWRIVANLATGRVGRRNRIDQSTTIGRGCTDYWRSFRLPSEPLPNPSDEPSAAQFIRLRQLLRSGRNSKRLWLFDARPAGQTPNGYGRTSVESAMAE